MHTSLDHLTHEEICDIKTRYYAGDAVYELMAQHGIHGSPSNFYKLLPPDPVEDYGCSKCKVNLVTDSVSRSKQQQKPDPSLYYCPICGRKPFAEKGGWLAYPSLSDEDRTRMKQTISAYFDKDSDPIPYASLSLKQKLYLSTLCKALWDKNRKVILPLSRKNVLLASSEEFQDDIYATLIKAGAIKVSSESDIDAFDIDSKRFPQKYDKKKVHYRLNIALPQENEKDLHSFGKLPRITCEAHDPEILALWKRIAIGECETYLQYRLNKVGFSFSPGEKTREVIQKLLENFSVSQIYYIIWCKVSDASRWYLEGGVSKSRAANSVIGACQRYGESAVFYERELPRYHRPAECPQSVLTRLFYYEILKLGSQADDLCLSQHIPIED